MHDYRFILASEQSANPAVIPDAPADLPVTAPDDVSPFGDAAGGAINRLERYAVSAVISPLNSATGGLAMPAFRFGKAAIGGASAGAIAGAGVGLVLAAVQLGINQINQTIEKHKSEAAALNERDNLLLRAGSKTVPTDYKGGLFGVKSVQRG